MWEVEIESARSQHQTGEPTINPAPTRGEHTHTYGPMLTTGQL